MEASLTAAQAELAATDSELQRQRALNEKLENDLLQMDRHKPNGDASGSMTPAEAGTPADALASLDLGKRTTVRLFADFKCDGSSC